jgi:hypothetical protein
MKGASNFRVMAGARVYGVAMSTLEGVRNVLWAVKQQAKREDEVGFESVEWLLWGLFWSELAGYCWPVGGLERLEHRKRLLLASFDQISTSTDSACSPPPHAPQEVLWFNMREEPVVYVNGRPFVLREQTCPMKNLQEYAGIDATRLERMERRLKEDVLAEAGESRCPHQTSLFHLSQQRGRVKNSADSSTTNQSPTDPQPTATAHYGGRILVARESAISGGGSGELIDAWEPVASPDAVQTPAEVYRTLRAEGHRVQYVRVPVTDGRAPAPEDVDVILAKVG